MKQSEAANQKIVGLDPSLVAEHSPTKSPNQTDKARIARSRSSSLNLSGRSKRRRSVHSEFLDDILLKFDEGILEADHPFMLQPHQVLEIIHRALPLLEKDATLTRIEAP